MAQRARPPARPSARAPPPAGHTTRAIEDIHELMKREAFGEGPGDPHFEKNRPSPYAPYGISDQYVVLDTFAKKRESRVDRGEFSWNFMVQGVTGSEVLGVKDVVDTVIAIQVSSFILPVLPQVPYGLADPPPTSPSGTNRLVLLRNNASLLGGPPMSADPLATWVHAPYTQLASGGRFTVQIREAGLQSFSDLGGARHHFEFAVIATPGGTPTSLTATPIQGFLWDTFTFTDPLRDVHGITLVFRNPDVPVRFEPDCFYDVPAAGDGAVAPGPFLRFGAPGHGLAAGDRVFVTGYQSGIAPLDAYVNRPAGHVVGGNPADPPLGPGLLLANAPFPGPYPDVFWLDPAVSLVDFVPPPAPQVVTVCVAKRRMRIPVRIRRIVDRLTNYLVPVF
jgi:hypothetical protein